MKWYGTVGYIIDSETAPGVYKNLVVRKQYYGDEQKLSSRWNDIPINDGSTINKSPAIQVELSIIADMYAYENFTKIRFVEYMGQYWSVRSIEPKRPRIILSLGDVYTGPIGDTNNA